jgi:NADPH-dependent 2,4-dienoyl-CoA reductase/sulfur reductase-like enzyme
MKVVIVGGVAGGMSAATRLRRLDEKAEIVVFEKGGYVSFANCGLPYYIGGVIGERSALLPQSPDGLRERFALDVRVGQEVLAIDRTAHTVTVRDHWSGVDYAQHWDHLVLSMGAEAVVPPVPGVERAHVLRDVVDADAIVQAAEHARTAVVIGAGFIGLEMAENLHARGLSVALVEQAGQVLSPLDPEMAQPVAAHLRAHGVEVRLGTRVAQVGPDTVVLGDGAALPADLVVTTTVQWHELDAARAGGATVLDVRTPDEFAVGAIPGAINAPLDQLRQNIADLPPGRLIVYCRVGQRGHTATRLLSAYGRETANLDGGFLTWQAGVRSASMSPNDARST